MRLAQNRRRWGPAIAALIGACLLAAAAGEALAQQPVTVIRGRLMRQSGMPAAGVPVTVSHPQLGRSGAAYSAPDGMYYLYGIPFGQYTLEVWVFPNRPPWVFQIFVGSQPSTDIAPIKIPG